jgi:nucleotide-binding universal stress UspA family protein
MSTILVGVDGSDTSTRALDMAAQWARNRGDELLVVHVIPWSPFSFNTPTENEHRHVRREQELAAAAEQVLDPMVERAKAAGVNVASVLVHGNPAETMVELAEERDAVHIVVGRSGDSMIKQAILGSIANRLAHSAPVPVTVVP